MMLNEGRIDRVVRVVLGLALLPFTALCLDRLILLSRRLGPWILALGMGAGFVFNLQA